jgi:hypothetical protein
VQQLVTRRVELTLREDDETRIPPDVNLQPDYISPYESSTVADKIHASYPVLKVARGDDELEWVGEREVGEGWAG